MWQRIQTLYLAVALGLLVAMFWHVTYLWWLILLGTACFMQVVAVLAYKFRLFQMRTAIIAALMLLGLQVWMAVAFLTGDKGAFNITAVFPAVAAILDALAARSIFSDELIVRSSSRLRSSKKNH